MNIEVDIRRAASPQLPVDRAALAATEPLLQAAAAALAARQARGEVGFLALDRVGWALDEAVALAGRLRARAETLIVLGIGGSALGARALQTALDGDGLVVLDSVDPRTIARVLADVDPRRAALAVVSKSGGTVETAALFRIFLPWIQANDDWQARVALVTDRASGSLRPMAPPLAALPIPDDVGGRFSVLTAVGVLPAAFAGVDVDALLAGASAMADRVRGGTLADNPAFRLAAAHHAWYGHANVSVMLSYCDRLRHFGEWWQQLWGESLGKRRGDGAVGWTPTVAMGPVDQHSQLQLWQEGPRDKVIQVLAVRDPEIDVPLPKALAGGGLPVDAVGDYLGGATLAELVDAERRGTMAALVDAGRPVIEVTVDRLDAATLGGLFVLFEQATALTGTLLGIEPFDQPGVEAGKRFAYGLMGRAGFEAEAARARLLLDG